MGKRSQEARKYQVDRIVNFALELRKKQDDFWSEQWNDKVKTDLQKKEDRERFREALRAEYGEVDEMDYLKCWSGSLFAGKGIIKDVRGWGDFPIEINLGKDTLGSDIYVRFEPRPLVMGEYRPSYTGIISSTEGHFKGLNRGQEIQFEGYLTEITEQPRKEPNNDGYRGYWQFHIATHVNAIQPSSKICFIATAAFGSPDESEVVTLREFRDRFLVRSIAGRLFIATYYRVSPPIARMIASSKTLRKVTRAMLRFFVLPLTKIE